MHQPGEPSVEEILESIKKVIARDTAAPAAPRRRAVDPAPAETATSDSTDEVLELDDGAMIAFAADDAGDEFAVESAADTGDAPLTAEATSTAMRENFAALAMLAQPGRQPQIVRSGETSLEGMTRDLLRPMLAQWLDANLPAMVEELVKAEIARIAGKKR